MPRDIFTAMHESLVFCVIVFSSIVSSGLESRLWSEDRRRRRRSLWAASSESAYGARESKGN